MRFQDGISRSVAYTISVFLYKTKNGYAHGGMTFLATLVILLLSPLAVIFYEVTLFIISALGIAHMARFARRHKKLFDKHIKDPDAHK